MEEKILCPYREKTLGEEITDLDIDKELKERLLKKWIECVKHSEELEQYLVNSHYRINELERALIEQACNLSTKLYNMRLEEK